MPEEKVGDFITFELPYGVFTYRVARHYIVAANRIDVLRDHGQEILRLQACHPRFFATNRYIVDAKLVSVQPRGSKSYTTQKLAAAVKVAGS